MSINLDPIHFKSIILYEDNHLLIVNKPAGYLVQPDAEGHNLSLEVAAKAYIKHQYQKSGEVYLGVPHRIDRPTSGIVIMCKTSKSLVRINQAFKDHQIQKTYWAIIEGTDIPDSDTWTHYLMRSSRENKSLVKNQPTPQYKEAKLAYRVLKRGHTTTLVSIQMFTGRHHQIRAQFAHQGYPLYGDQKYGSKRGLTDRSIGLHAKKVTLIHPVTNECLTVEAPIRNESLWLSLASDL